MGSRYSPILSEAASKSSIDKESLYGEFLKSIRRKGRIESLAISKALDLPVEDEVQIKTGITGWPLVALLLGGSGMASWLISSLMVSSSQPSPAQSTVPSLPQESQSSQVQVELFYDDPERGLVPIPGAADPLGGLVP